MQNRFQEGSLILTKNKTAPHTWFFRYREDRGGKRVNRKIRLGSTKELPHRRDAEKAALHLRVKANSEVRVPETVSDAIAHYTKHELTPERKSFATLDAHKSYLKLHILPTWGAMRLTAVRTVKVETWLDSLSMAPATRAKIRNIMSAVFSHAIRWEWIAANPISKVRTSSIRVKEPEVLTPEEFRLLISELEPRERTMVMLAGSTGLRRSEMFALRWSDLSMTSMEVSITRAVVRSRFGDVKTPASKKPVPLHSSVVQALQTWRQQSAYASEADFLFPSIRKNGESPMVPDMVLRKTIRPALQRAGIQKQIGWHSFRHSLATNLRSLGVDVKVAQELLRHANSRITMDLYTQAVSADKRDASRKQMDFLVGKELFPSVPSNVLALS